MGNKRFMLWVFVLIVLLGSCVYMGGDYQEQTNEYMVHHDEDEVFREEHIRDAMLQAGALVQVVGTVEEFEFNNVTKEKYLRLNVDDYVFNAVISKDVKVPYLNVGDVYRFWGVTIDYEGLIKLDVSAID